MSVIMSVIPIWQFSIAQLEGILAIHPVTIIGENPQQVWVLSKDNKVYACASYRGPNHKWKGTQLGHSLAEVLLRSVFDGGVMMIGDKVHEP